MKKNPIPSAAGLGLTEHSKTRTGSRSQQLGSCPVSLGLGAGGGQRRDTAAWQLRSGCAHYFRPCVRAKLTMYARGVATELMCCPGPQDRKEARGRNPRKTKPAPKLTCLQPNAA